MSIYIILAAAAVLLYLYRRKSKNAPKAYPIPAGLAALLEANVDFYRQLPGADRTSFEARVRDFLEHVRITGVGTVVEDLDRALIAAGAIIPIFAFPGWRYNNISEVLLYKGSFSKDYRIEGEDINVLGMVGEGAMNRQMILSQASVRSSFRNAGDKHNTVIHEFVHLIDKADGSTDGVPEYLLQQPYLIPWLKTMHRTIAQMRNTGRSDIDLYGATNDAEFFAVVSEYFFERPAALADKHPELYRLLQQVFHTGNVTDESKT